MDSKIDPVTRKMVGQAYDLYDSTLDRLISRFQRGGNIPGMAILMSSKTTTTSFTENRLRALTHLKDVEGVRGAVTSPGEKHATAYYACYSLWDIYPERYQTKKHFLVEVGDHTNRSRIVPDGEKPREDARTIKVPDLPPVRKRFTDDPDAALRNLAGVGTNAISPFIRDPKQILRSIDQDYANPFPLHMGEASLPICTTMPMDLCDEFDLHRACIIERGRWRPRLAPECPRFMHVDLSLNGDATGIAMGFYDGNRRVEKLRTDGTKVYSFKPIIRFDFVLRIHAEPNTEIDFEKIFSFIKFLTQFYAIQTVNFDQFQSGWMKQRIISYGINSELLSLDRSVEPYMGFRSAIRENRIFIPHTHTDEKLKQKTHPIFHKEATNLIFDIARKKIDHPDLNPDNTIGSKDVCDACAGVVEAIHQHLENQRSTGAQQEVSKSTAAKAEDRQDEWRKLTKNLPVR